MNWIVTLCAIAVLVLGCWLVGRALEKRWGLDPARETPSQDCFDGKDYVPTPKIVVLGHHFSSIAGAGTIVGAVIAASYGWLPALLWIVIGGVFFAAAHDFGALFASLRHKGRSLGFVLREHAGVKAQRLFTIFALLVLVLLVACFTNVIASAFASSSEGGVLSLGMGQVSAQAGAGTAAILFVLVGLLFGLMVFRKNLPMVPMTVLCLVLMAGAVWASLNIGLNLPYAVWVGVIAVYIVAASLAPVWSLLQPRDFLSAFLLWGMMAFCLVVLLLPHEFSAPLPAVDFHGQNPGYAILSVLVMGGAVSGYNALIASGTTAKQLANEKHARGVSVGSVALNAVLAVIVLLAMREINLRDYNASPLDEFAHRVANAAGSKLAYSLVLLTASVFALTTLDTCTRLARYLFGELFNPNNRRIAKLEGAQKFFARPAAGTLILVLLGCGLGLVRDLNRLWPLFGAANLLLAGHALHTVVIFLRHEKKSHFLPLIGMSTAMAAGLCFLAVNAVQVAANAADWIDWLVVGVSVVLAVLSFLLVYARPGKPGEAADDAD